MVKIPFFAVGGTRVVSWRNMSVDGLGLFDGGWMFVGNWRDKGRGGCCKYLFFYLFWLMRMRIFKAIYSAEQLRLDKRVDVQGPSMLL